MEEPSPVNDRTPKGEGLSVQGLPLALEGLGCFDLTGGNQIPGAVGEHEVGFSPIKADALPLKADALPLISRLKRVTECVGLFRSGQQFELDGQTHSSCPLGIHISRIPKYTQLFDDYP